MQTVRTSWVERKELFLVYTKAWNRQQTYDAQHQSRKNKSQWYKTGQQEEKVKF